MRSLFLIGAVLVGLPGAARAQVCDAALAVRINETGFGFVAEQVRPFVPEEFELPAMDRVVLDWPLTSEDARIEMPPTLLKFDLKELRIHGQGDTVHLVVTLDVTGGSPLRVHNPYLGFGTADCQADLQLRDLRVDLGASIATGSSLRLNVASVSIDYDKEVSVAALDGCLVGDVLTAVVNFVRKHFHERVTAKLEELAKSKLPPVLEAALSRTIQFSGEVNDLTYLARLDGVSTSDGGLEVLLGAQLDLFGDSQPPACMAGLDLTPPASCASALPKIDPRNPSMFSAGVTQGLLNNALHSVWRSGRLCLTSAQLAQKNPGIAQALEGVSTTLGQEPGTEVAFAVHVHKPPRLSLSPGAGAQVEIDELQLDITLTPPNGQVGGVSVVVAAAVGAVPTIAPRSGAIGLDLRQVAVDRMAIVGRADNGGTIELDPARIERFINVVVMPMLQEELAKLELSPAVIGVEALAAYGVPNVLVQLNEIRVEQGFLSAYVDAYVPPAGDDAIAPQTVLVEGPGALVGPQLVTIYVAGNDDVTPASLLKYRHRVDGAEWSEPTFSRRVDVPATDGQHTVEIAALDLQGNSDPTPLSIAFEVDAELPTVQILGRPESLIEDDSASVQFSGSDGRTAPEALAFQVKLLRVPDGGGAPQVRETLPFATGVSSATFSGLNEGVFRIRVTARDEAGNVTSADVGFTVHHPGCNVASGGGNGLGIGLGLLLLLLLGKGRRCRAIRPR